MEKTESLQEKESDDGIASSERSFLQQQWPALLDLQLAEREGGTYLQHCQHQGPLTIQKPFYPEGNQCAHIYVLHPPGGLCSGDHLQMRITASKNANTLITSPGATRIYKARQPYQQQDQPTTQLQRVTNALTIGQYGCIEWFPMETIVYPQANALMQTDITMDSNAIFIGWEIICLGLPASHLPFTLGKVHQCIRILIDNKIRIIDKLQLEQPSCVPTASPGLRHQHVMGLMLAGPFNQAPTDLIQQLQSLQQLHFINIMVSITYVKQFLIFRYLGDSAVISREFFVLAWQLIRPLLCAREACLPAIWRT